MTGIKNYHNSHIEMDTLLVDVLFAFLGHIEALVLNNQSDQRNILDWVTISTMSSCYSNKHGSALKKKKNNNTDCRLFYGTVCKKPWCRHFSWDDRLNYAINWGSVYFSHVS